MKFVNLFRDNLISINDIVMSLKKLEKVPDETRAQMIVEVLDEDKDGKVDISLALKVSFLYSYLLTG